MQCCGSASNSTTIATPARLTEQSKSNIWDGQWASNFRRQLRIQIFWASTTQLKKKISLKYPLWHCPVLQFCKQLCNCHSSKTRRADQRSNIGIGIQLQEAAEIQYFGVRELMYQYNIEEEKWCIAYYTKKHPTVGGWNIFEQEALQNPRCGVSILHTLAQTLVTNCRRVQYFGACTALQ